MIAVQYLNLKRFNDYITESIDKTDELDTLIKLGLADIQFDVDIDDYVDDDLSMYEKTFAIKWKSDIDGAKVKSVIGKMTDDISVFDIQLTNSDSLLFNCRYDVSPRPTPNRAELNVKSSNNDQYVTVNLIDGDSDLYMEELEHWGSRIMAVLEVYDKLRSSNRLNEAIDDMIQDHLEKQMNFSDDDDEEDNE